MPAVPEGGLAAVWATAGTWEEDPYAPVLAVKSPRLLRTLSLAEVHLTVSIPVKMALVAAAA